MGDDCICGPRAVVFAPNDEVHAFVRFTYEGFVELARLRGGASKRRRSRKQMKGVKSSDAEFTRITRRDPSR